MLHRFLFHLLGSWLLLSRLPREIQGQKAEVFIKCGREFVHFFIDVCGTNLWAEEMRRNRNVRSEPSAEIMQFSTTENTENLNMIRGFTSTEELKTALDEKQPLLKETLKQASSEDTNLNFEELKKNSLHTIEAREKKSVSELNNMPLVKHFLKKRQAPPLLSTKCCSLGCTKKEVAQFC